MILTGILIFILLFSFVLLIVITSAFLGFLMTRVPFVPTYASDIEFFVKKLGIKPADIFFDLGSGNGKVCFLVNRLSGASCVGYELTCWTHLIAKITLKLNPPVGGQNAKLQFKNQNFFKHSWAEANYVYGYLYPPLMRRVEEKFLADCKPGSIAIIRDFPFPKLKPVDVYQMPKKHEIYIYRK